MKHNYQVIFMNVVNNNEYGLMLKGITKNELNRRLENNSILNEISNRLPNIEQLYITSIEDYGEYR